ncbi:MAG: Hdr-like menaquinol oxidoreductase cytochrome c subunit [Leptothrix sp. (in: Bacteria)]|nr:Hdr-like menaquinol oxidoreductase cytochrome c subunit [Leptothrix sp. (in: b-proteobacteria)]
MLWLVVGVSLQAAAAGEGRTPKPVVEAATAGTQCVAPPEVMRRDHMDFLKHQRDDTVHGGIRGAKFSLKACIDCHANQKTQSVAKDESNFCVSCHSYAAVKIDCFECHTAKARTVAQGAPK